MINGDQAKGFLQFFLGTIENEFTATKKVISVVPDGGNWRPDPKAKTGIELAWHLATSEMWFMDGIANGAFDMSGEAPPAPKTIAEIVQFYEKAHRDGVAKLKALSGEQLSKSIPFFGVSEMPAVMYLNFLLLHSAHHRGQLSVYLRP